jgi:hypothetical protein
MGERKMVIATLLFAIGCCCLALWVFATNRPCPGLRSFLLVGDELEVRCVPAAHDTYLWDPPQVNANNNWSNFTNWDMKVGGVFIPATHCPGRDGTDDDVIFQGGEYYNTACFVNVSVTVHKVEIKAEYTSNIVLQNGNSLTLSGSDSESVLHQDGGLISGDKGNNQVGSIILASRANFMMRAGSLNFVKVDVQRSQKTAEMHFARLAGTSPQLRSTEIDVHGKLEWNDTDVGCERVNDNFPINVIHVYPGGVFNMLAAGKTMGCSVESFG